MPGEAYKERVSYPYAVTYGWPGLPTTTKIVDLQREVTVGTQIHVDRQQRSARRSIGATRAGRIRDRRGAAVRDTRRAAVLADALVESGLLCVDGRFALG